MISFSSDFLLIFSLIILIKTFNFRATPKPHEFRFKVNLYFFKFNFGLTNVILYKYDNNYKLFGINLLEILKCALKTNLI